MSLLSLAPYDRLGHMEWTNISIRKYNIVVQSQLEFVPLRALLPISCIVWIPLNKGHSVLSPLLSKTSDNIRWFVLVHYVQVYTLFSAHEFTFITLSTAAEVVIILTQCTLYKFVLGGRFKKSELFSE